MKKLLGVSMITLGLAVGAPAGAAELGKTRAEIEALAKKEGVVRIAATWRKDLHKAISRGFGKKYGIKIEHTRVRGLASRERILSEAIAGAAPYDLLNVSGELRHQFKKADLLYKVPWTQLFKGIEADSFSPEGYFVATGFSLYGIIYNTKMVSAAEVPKTWADCTDPKWKGEVLVMTRPRAFTSLWAGWGKDKSLEFHKKLIANKPVWSGGNTETATKVAAGEHPISCGPGLHSVVNTKRRDPSAPLAFQVPENLPVHIGEALGILKSAKNANAAVLLAGYLASDAGQGHYHLQGRSSPFVENSVAWKLVRDNKSKVVWGGWDFEGPGETEATKEIVKAWGFPKTK
jgi:iron(III) transport system substrate-binding protein